LKNVMGGLDAMMVMPDDMVVDAGGTTTNRCTEPPGRICKKSNGDI
jgi:hypothetical protein